MNGPEPTGRGLPGRVLFLHSADEAYGSDRILLAMAGWLHAQGVVVRVLLPRDTEPGWLSEALELRGIEVDRANLAVARRRYLRPAAVPTYLRDLASAASGLRRQLRQLQPDLVHVNTSALVVGSVLRLGRRRSFGVVWHVHEIVRQPRLLAFALRRLPLSADAVIAVSSAVASNLPASAKVRRVWNGLDPRPVPARVASPIARVAFVGRLSEWKGYRLFFDVACSIAEVRDDVHFTIAGSPLPGEEWREAEMRQSLADRGLGDRVELLGFYTQPLELFDATDIAVVPSLEPDPLPTVVLEAMRSGCAVVASGHGGAPEMIEHDRSGILFTPGDAGSLRNALNLLLDDRLRGVRLGEAAASRVATVFSNEQFRSGLRSAYAEALDAAARRCA